MSQATIELAEQSIRELSAELDAERKRRLEIEQNFKDRVTEEVERAALALRRCTPAERGVLDAMHAIPDGTLRALLELVVVSFSSSLTDALRAELARREAAK